MTAKLAVLNVLFNDSKLLLSLIIILFCLSRNNNFLAFCSHVNTKQMIPRYWRFIQTQNKITYHLRIIILPNPTIGIGPYYTRSMRRACLATFIYIKKERNKNKGTKKKNKNIGAKLNGANYVINQYFLKIYKNGCNYNSYNLKYTRKGAIISNMILTYTRTIGWNFSLKKA